MQRGKRCSWCLGSLAVAACCTGLAITPHDALADEEVTTFDSVALANNAAGDPATRSARVYLPPSYETSEKRYPVLYLLHGTGGNENTFLGIADIADQFVQQRRSEEFIIVSADGSSKYAASFYENSELNGNHRDYIVQDLVQHIDSTYRTVPNRDSRAVAGHSTGGYGAILYGMKHPDVFGGVYSFSGGGLCFSRPECITYLGGEVAEFSDGLKELGDPFEQLTGIVAPDQVTELLQREMYSMASAFSPNLANEPLLVDMPWDSATLEVIPEVRDRWYEHDLFLLLPDYADNLSALRAFGVDVGDQDEFGLHDESVAFHEALVEAEVDHDFEVFEGTHGNKLGERIALSLTFFSSRLVIPEEVLPCDFNIDAACTADDLADTTLFSVDLSKPSSDVVAVRRFDINNDRQVNADDLTTWLDVAAQQNGFAASYLLGDANLDGFVGFADFLALADNFGTESHNWSQGDFDGNTRTEFADFLILADNFGVRVEKTEVSAVPEPTTVSITIAALFIVGGWNASGRHSGRGGGCLDFGDAR